MTDFAFNQTLSRYVGFGALPPEAPQAPQPRAAPPPQSRVLAPPPQSHVLVPRPQSRALRAPVGVGQAYAGWNTLIRGPMLPGLQSVDPPPGGPTWWNYSWIYMTTGGAPLPTNPPPGVTATSASNVIGTWVETDSTTGRWVWFAPDNMLTQINGIWVMDNSNAPSAPNPWSAFPAPTLSPDGTQGTWSEVHEGYWVWTPGGVAGALASATSTVAGMSTGTLILLALLGVGAIGGIGYLLLD